MRDGDLAWNVIVACMVLPLKPQRFPLLERESPRLPARALLSDQEPASSRVSVNPEFADKVLQLLGLIG